MTSLDDSSSQKGLPSKADKRPGIRRSTQPGKALQAKPPTSGNKGRHDHVEENDSAIRSPSIDLPTQKNGHDEHFKVPVVSYRTFFLVSPVESALLTCPILRDRPRTIHP